MSFPNDQIARDIRKRGRLVTLIKIDDEPDAGQDVTAKQKPVRQSDVDGDRVLEGDQMLQMIPSDVTGRAPEVGDEVIIGGARFGVQSAITKTRQGAAIRYDLRVRR